MSKGTSYSSQIWRTRTYFPEEEIKRGWEEGKRITHLTYGNGLWVLVMSKGTSYSSQIWRTRTYFPEEEIKRGWEEGKRITHLTYGNGLWALVMSEGTGIKSQIWRKRGYFPEEEIAKGWNDNKHVTSLTYDNKFWILVMSESNLLTNQLWRTRINFPKEEIDKGWNSGYNISFISYGEYDKSKIPGQQAITTIQEQVSTTSTIHFILFTDTEDSRVGSSCGETNKFFMNTFVPKLKNNSGMNVKTYYYSGNNNYTLANLNSIISNLSTGPNDVVFFYYAGHGYNRGRSNYPTITFGISGDPIENRQKDLIDIYSALRSKQHRLLVVMAESCNKIYQSRNDVRVASLIGNFMIGEDFNRHFIELFRDASGDYLMSSSSNNQLSHLATGQPGFFTCGFRDAFSEVTSTAFTGIATWSEIFKRTITKTKDSAYEIGEIQVPQWCQGSDCY
jgi:hypothetical protein